MHDNNGGASRMRTTTIEQTPGQTDKVHSLNSHRSSTPTSDARLNPSSPLDRNSHKESRDHPPTQSYGSSASSLDREDHHPRWQYTDDPEGPRDESRLRTDRPRVRYAHGSSPAPTRPLIEQVTNSWRDKDGSYNRNRHTNMNVRRASTSTAYSSGSEASTTPSSTAREDVFFSADWDDDSLPKRLPYWIRRARRSPWLSAPRRLQRWLLPFALAVAVCWFGYARYMHSAWEELARLDKGYKVSERHDSLHRYGQHMPIQLDGVIQVKSLDKKHLPGHGRGGKGRLVFVGDIHGCKHELLKLLDKLDFDRRRDHLVATGDMISKGPDSPGVVNVLRDMGASCVRGNHEDRVLLAREHLKAHPSSGESVADEEERERRTLSKADARARHTARQLSDKQADYLSHCPVILRVGQVPGMGEVAAVHAGLVPGVRLERQDPFQVMNMRSIDADTRVPSEGREFERWEKVWEHYQKKRPKKDRFTVVYGHDSKRGLNLQKWSKGLDSGCVNGDRLTALVVDPQGRQEIVSVKCRNGNKVQTVGGGASGDDDVAATGEGEAEGPSWFQQQEQTREEAKKFWVEGRAAEAEAASGPATTKLPCFMD